MKITIEEAAVRQLESAIWMYAYDFDEAAVHTIAGAALELYTKRLGLGSFLQQAKSYIKPGKEKEFLSIMNGPYNFFKHGEHKRKPLEFINYNPESVEFILIMAVEANLMGDPKYQAKAARKYRIYFMLKNPDLMIKQYPLDPLFEKLLSKAKEVTWDREALKFVLNSLPSPLPAAPYTPRA